MRKTHYPKDNDKGHKGYLLSLKLTDDQKQILDNCFAASRFAWNSILKLEEYLYIDNLKKNHPGDYKALEEKAYNDEHKNNRYRRQLEAYENYKKSADNVEVLEAAQEPIEKALGRIKIWNETHPDKERPLEISHLGEYDIKLILTVLRRNHKGEKDYPLCLPYVASTVARSALSDLELAYQAFWRNLKQNPAKAGKPRFKSRFGAQTCGYNEGVKKRALGKDREGMKLAIPKLGEVECHSKRHLPKGKVKRLRIVRTADGRIHASLTLDQGTAYALNLSKIKDNKIVGVNLNYSDNVVTLSNGKTYQMDFDKLRTAQKNVDRWGKHLAMRKNRYDERYAIQKDHLAKQKKLDQLPAYNPYSVSGVKKARHALAKAHARLANIRKYWWTQLVTDLTRNYQVICTPKYNVDRLKQTSRYGKELLTLSGIGMFNVMLKAQERKNGCHIIEVEPSFVTQKCHVCGEVDTETFGTKEEPKQYTKERWTCHNCGATLLLHQNAAINVRQLGMEQLKIDAEKQIEKRK